MKADNQLLHQDSFSKHHLKTHGHASGSNKTKIYIVWRNMKSRCLNQSATDYPNYGGRGITICERWINSFANFLADMGIQPSPKHTIERRDSNGNYEPSNCRWATQKEQGNNRRNNVFIEHDGMRKTISQWAEYAGIGMKTLHQRISDGWDFRTAITKPVKKCRSPITAS